MDVILEGRLTEIKGIGKGIGGLVSEAVLEGTWGGLADLYEKIPVGLVEMIGIPGLGPKRAKILYDKLGIDTVDALGSACEKGLIAPLSGFGRKSEQKYLEGIDLFRRYQGRSRMDVGLLYGKALEERMEMIPGVQKAKLAGSARRRRETIGDLDVEHGRCFRTRIIEWDWGANVHHRRDRRDWCDDDCFRSSARGLCVGFGVATSSRRVPFCNLGHGYGRSVVGAALELVRKALLWSQSRYKTSTHPG